MSKVKVRYEVRDFGSLGGYYAQEGYSKFYKNDCRYDLEDALAHKAELLEKHPYGRFEVVQVVTTEIVIG